MATKSRRSRFSIGFKILAWALCIASVCGISFSARAISISGITNAVPNYADSYDSISSLQEYTNVLQRAYFDISEETARRETDERIAYLRQQRWQEIVSMLGWTYYEVLEGGTGILNYETDQTLYINDYSDSTVAKESASTDTDTGETIVEEAAAEEEIAVAETASESAVSEDSTLPFAEGGQRAILSQYEQDRLSSIVTKYDQLFEGAEQYVLDAAATQQNEARTYIQSRTDMNYVIQKSGNTVEDNLNPEENRQSIIDRDAKMISVFSSNNSVEYMFTGPGRDDHLEFLYDKTIFYVAPTYDAYALLTMEYDKQYEEYTVGFTWLIICIIVFIVGLVWVLYTAGKSPHDDKKHIHAIDKLVYFDIGFVIMVAAAIFLMLGAYLSAGSLYQYFGTAEIDAVGVFGVCACLGGAISTFLLWATSLARRNRYGDAKQFTLAYVLFGSAKKLYDESDIKAKAVGAFVWYVIFGLAIIALTIIGAYDFDSLWIIVGIALMIVYIMLSLKFVLKKTAAIAEIAKGVEEIKGGELEYTIPMRGNHDLDNIAEGINNIAEGLSNAVHKEVKSERMKTELITNISHDLKTPLTSILTYVDLLKKEEGLSDDAKKYLSVLDTKSHRLKVLTDDLFEAAKASSGDMTVELSRIELIQLLEQAFGEISDRMDASSLTFISDIPQDAVYVHADGKLLFRVINNVMDNVLKYALPGSRVYLSMERTEEGMVHVTVKNISKEELNITEDELMERFVRGDSSRNTEGSGLGLAIARNFMQLMGGRFLIDIDGDLFKATIELPLLGEPGTEAAAAEDE